MQKKRDAIAIEYLQKNVYPDLHQALMKLIEHVVKTEEVRKHQERLKKIKIFDRLEQKKVEKDRLKAELGSAYESSDSSSIDFDEMGINEDDYYKLMGKKPEPESPHNEGGGPEQQSEEQITSQEVKKDTILSIGEIREEPDDDDNAEQNELEKMKQLLKQQREQAAYNPLIHLAQFIREGLNK